MKKEASELQAHISSIQAALAKLEAQPIPDQPHLSALTNLLQAKVDAYNALTEHNHTIAD